MTDSWNHAKCCELTLVAMATKFGLGAEIQSPTSLYIYSSTAMLNMFKQKLKTELYIRNYDQSSSYAHNANNTFHIILSLHCYPTAPQLFIYFFIKCSSSLQTLCRFIIPHLEMHACDWTKSRHVTFTKSGYFPHEAILPHLFTSIVPPCINIASMSSLIFLNNSQNHSTDKSKSQFFASYTQLSLKYEIILMKQIDC